MNCCNKQLLRLLKNLMAFKYKEIITNTFVIKQVYLLFYIAHVWFGRLLVLSFRQTNMVVYTLEQRWDILQHIDLQKMQILAKKIIFLDEAHFDFGGYVNKQNCCIWGSENPYTYIEKPTYPKRVIVWCRV